MGGTPNPAGDVVWVQSLAVDGIQQASRLGMMAIGFFSDGRLTVGEAVITSAVLDFSPARGCRHTGPD